MIRQLGLVNVDQRAVMKQEVLRCRLPPNRVALTIHFHSATGNDEVNVRMIDHRITTPGVQHPEEAGQVPADVFFIGRQCFQCLGRGGEHGGVANLLVAADEAPQLLWKRKCDHEVMPGQFPIQLGLQPLPGFMVLAIGAMPIATAPINDVVLPALGALIDRSAVMTGAAADDGRDDFEMISGHAVTEALGTLSGRISGYKIV